LPAPQVAPLSRSASPAVTYRHRTGYSRRRLRHESCRDEHHSNNRRHPASCHSIMFQKGTLSVSTPIRPVPSSSVRLHLVVAFGTFVSAQAQGTEATTPDDIHLLNYCASTPATSTSTVTHPISRKVTLNRALQACTFPALSRLPYLIPTQHHHPTLVPFTSTPPFLHRKIRPLLPRI
jgi:hypothetical protein